jgi:acetyl esterase/lipase
MKVEKIDLYKYFKIKKPENADGHLTTYILENCIESRLRPAMLVIPGGGYSHVSVRENECVALKYMEKGFNAFTLSYSVKGKCDVCFPYQLLEGAMAMAYIKKNAKKLGVDRNQVAAIGFSTGGHLCGMLATMFNAPEVVEALGNNAKYVRPDAVVLSYPVITAGEKSHKGSFINLSGGDESLYERLSLQNQVTEESSPAFIWSTMADAAVPMENSLYMVLAYREKKVPCEFHVFERGGHGLSVATQESVWVNVPIQQWIPLSITWLENRGFKLKK